MQGIWASLLALSGQYGDLFDMISFVIVLFYMITVFGVIYMRMKQPMQKESYKTWLYPVTPIIYLLIGTAFCVLLFIYKPNYTWPGLVLILIGLPVYYVINKRNSEKSKNLNKYKKINKFTIVGLLSSFFLGNSFGFIR